MVSWGAGVFRNPPNFFFAQIIELLEYNYPSIVDQRIEPTELRLSCRNCGIPLSPICYVEMEKGLAKLARECFPFDVEHICDHHLCAFSDKTPNDTLTNTSSPTCHKGHFANEPVHYVYSDYV